MIIQAALKKPERDALLIESDRCDTLLESFGPDDGFLAAAAKDVQDETLGEVGILIDVINQLEELEHCRRRRLSL
ncbi:MAG: hypothetical protein JO025_23545 [Verrucomicrobia bacterium]|nr:hypothetical protein [Verrucomicrobiota bacterium]